jgi:hypothetical protein
LAVDVEKQRERQPREIATLAERRHRFVAAWQLDLGRAPSIAGCGRPGRGAEPPQRRRAVGMRPTARTRIEVTVPTKRRSASDPADTAGQPTPRRDRTGLPPARHKVIAELDGFETHGAVRRSSVTVSATGACRQPAGAWFV